MGSEERTEKRCEEILNACGKLYETRGFSEITIRDIGRETSMSRPSIYNYFETKEEIFLGLLTREYQLWTESIDNITSGGGGLTPDDLAMAIAETLEPRVCLLKISAMNLYEIEDKSRLENLMEFKRAFKRSLESFQKCLKTFMPELTDQRIDEIRYAFFPFMYGIYPYVYPTDKQSRAMDEIGISHQSTTITDLTYNFLKQIIY